jgi:hypothetical protein
MKDERGTMNAEREQFLVFSFQFSVFRQEDSFSVFRLGFSDRKQRVVFSFPFSVFGFQTERLAALKTPSLCPL